MLSVIWRALVRAAVIPVVLFFCSACGSSSDSGDKVATPVVLNLYPSTYDNTPPRLFIMAGVGNSGAINIPLAFDTGSSGVTMVAESVFPPDMVDSNGFKFPPGQTSISYQGILVTNNQGMRKYGGTTGRTEYGNIGYANLTFGDSAGHLTTQVMPIFFYYFVALTSDVGTGSASSSVPPAPSQAQQGWFGVNQAADLISVTSTAVSGPSYPLCDSTVSGSCYVVSALKYLSFGPGFDAGFALSPATLQSCDITTSGSCQPEPILQVGIDPDTKSAFNLYSLSCNFATVMQGYPNCNTTVPVVVSGGSTTCPLPTGTIMTLFDTGNPAVDFDVSAASGSTTFPCTEPSGSQISIGVNSEFSFSYLTGSSSITTTSVSDDPKSPAGIGIVYFTEHSFLIDFTTSQEGWR